MRTTPHKAPEHYAAQTTVLTLQTMMDNKQLGEQLNRMAWVVVPLRGSYSLLTSDRPLVMTNGISGPGKHLGMPIGPRLLFIAADDRDEVEQLEDGSLFARLTTVGSGKGNGAEFPLVSPLAANLKKYHAESDVSLFPLIMGTYAPTAVRKMFAEMFANPPKDATPDHLREAVELCAAASRGY